MVVYKPKHTLLILMDMVDTLPTLLTPVKLYTQNTSLPRTTQLQLTNQPHTTLKKSVVVKHSHRIHQYCGEKLCFLCLCEGETISTMFQYFAYLLNLKNVFSQPFHVILINANKITNY